jgi:hypothetical protein
MGSRADGAPRLLRFARLTAVTLVGAAVGIVGCSDSTNPSEEILRDPASVSALVLDSAGPTLAADSVGFWAVKGEDRSTDIFFADSAGTPGGRLLHFEVTANGLDRALDGHRLKNGDSIFISIRAADPGALSFEFEPAGLKFKPHGASLIVNYARAIPDTSSSDETQLAVWVQEQALKPYKKITSHVDTVMKEITGDVPGFSKYAVAY